jgi:phosphoribosyl 1,2-cyclic phosphodiesterase
MKVRFWGVRGSIAVSGPRYVGTGGNTATVEVEHEGERLILDGGTGLRALGDHIGWRPVSVHLLFSHVHWDHIQGVPFFMPAFHPGATLRLHGAARASGSLRDALGRQMRPPQFPITLDALTAKVDCIDIPVDRPFEIGPFSIQPIDLNHPDGVLAYRITAGGRSIVYATDTEHGAALDLRLLRLAEGADLLIHDAQYTTDEYEGRGGPSRRGWGHSTWQQAVAAAQASQVRRLALFHHDPGRDDAGVAQIEAAAQARHPGAAAAREGEVWAL